MKLFNYLLSLMLIIPIGINAAVTDYDFKNAGIYYLINTNTSTNESYVEVVQGESPYTGTLIIPNSVAHNGVNYAVKIIADAAFVKSPDLISITIPSSVTKISHNAFGGCKNLREVILEDGSETLYIGVQSYLVGPRQIAGLWIDCPIAYFYMGRNLEQNEGYYDVCTPFIGYTHFDSNESEFHQANYQLEKVVIGDMVTEIPPYMFFHCRNLKDITMSKSVTSIGYNAFCYTGITSIDFWPEGHYLNVKGCSKLKEIIIPNSIKNVGSFDDCYGLERIVVHGSVAKIGSFKNCSHLTEVILEDSDSPLFLPGTHHGDSSPAEYAPYGTFNLSPLEKVYIGRNITCDFYPFQRSNTTLTDISFGNKVTSIPDGLCYGLKGLVSIDIPNTVTSIGTAAFSCCSNLTKINLEENDTYCFQEGALYNKQMTRLMCAVGGSSSLKIPSSVTNIDKYAFHGCVNLRELTIEDSDISLYLRDSYGGENDLDAYDNYGMFAECTALNSVYIGRNLTYYCYPFQRNNTSITEIKIGNPVTAITEGLCYNMTALSDVYLSRNVLNINNKAFYGCRNISNITCEALETPAMGSNVFYGVENEKVSLLVPNQSVDTYMAHPIWGQFNIQKMYPDTDLSSLENAVYAEATEGFVGKIATIPVRMKHSMDISEIQFDVYMPDGVSIDSRSRGTDLTQVCPLVAVFVAFSGIYDSWRALLGTTDFLFSEWFVFVL